MKKNTKVKNTKKTRELSTKETKAATGAAGFIDGSIYGAGMVKGPRAPGGQPGDFITKINNGVS